MEDKEEQNNRVTNILLCYLSCVLHCVFLDENNNFNFDANRALFDLPLWGYWRCWSYKYAFKISLGFKMNTVAI